MTAAVNGGGSRFEGESLMMVASGEGFFCGG